MFSPEWLHCTLAGPPGGWLTRVAQLRDDLYSEIK